MAAIPHYDQNGEVNSTNLNAWIDETNLNTGKRPQTDQNTSDIQQNTAAIQQNTSDIQQNTTDIQNNATAINNNATAINNNTTAISNNTNAISAIETSFNDLSYIPFAAGYYTDNTTSTNITVDNTWQKVVIQFTGIHSNTDSVFTVSNSEIIYTGLDALTVKLTLRLDGIRTSGGTGDENIEFQFRKNGLVLNDDLKGGVDFESTDYTQPVIFNITDISQNDVLEFWVRSTTGITEITIRNGIFAINL